MDKLLVGAMLLMWFVGMPIIVCGICKWLGFDGILNEFAVKHGLDLGLWTEKEPEGAGTPAGNGL